MATFAAFLRRNGDQEAEKLRAPELVKPAPDPYRLRPLPHDDVFLYCKRIDNTRLVRHPDPEARGTCWSLIGAACVMLLLVTSILIPSVASTLVGYRLESLKAEERQLLHERRVLELEEARLVSPARLEEQARSRNLVSPKAGQIQQLGDGGAVAMKQ